MKPDFSAERELWRSGARFVAGIDEVGRGPLAGPVCVAAVIFAADATPIRGVDDSKKLNRAAREDLAPRIVERALAVAIAFAPPDEIDRLNIRQATLLAMSRAVAGLAVRPDFALIDGRDLPPGLPCAARALIGGDALSFSIAAASIVAKVTRDRLMTRLDAHYPGYGFAAHAGYGTLAHRRALTALGPCPAHRLTFKSAPVTAC